MKDAQFPDDILHVNLFILAAKDAHILLSPTNQQEKTSAVYEIGKLNESTKINVDINWVFVLCGSYRGRQ